jgi:hypothetical protein
MSATLLGSASICLSNLFWAISNCSSWGPCGKINFCRQAEDSSEKALARRQLIVKPDSSASWFVGIKHLHRKYELKEAISYLDEPESLLCRIYDPVSNLSFTESLDLKKTNNGWIFPFSRFSNVRNVSPLYNGIKLVILSTHFLGTNHLTCR